MSSLVAIAIALVLCGAALVPMAWALRGGGARIAIGSYTAAILAMAVYQTGFFERYNLTPTSGIVVAPTSVADGRCVEIRRVVREAGLSLDTSDPQQPRIVGPTSEQIPESISEVIIKCLTSGAPTPQASPPL